MDPLGPNYIGQSIFYYKIWIRVWIGNMDPGSMFHGGPYSI